MRSQPKRALWLWPPILIAAGIVLLLDNFLLLDVDLTPYWPILLVLLGIQLLLRGDIGFSWQTHTFGITRGSVQSASLEIESGELDVQLRTLRKPGRLIAGQYTARSRPGLTVRNNHATLRMERGQTWWLSLADWDVGLAHDLPWSLLVSSYLGRLDIDLRGLTIERAYISSGLGSVNIVCPDQPAGLVFARSTFGDVRLSIPENCRTIIQVKAGPFARVRTDSSRFANPKPGTYVTAENGDTVEPDINADVIITAYTVFGSIFIS
jgi:hypothetical protein